MKTNEKKEKDASFKKFQTQYLTLTDYLLVLEGNAFDVHEALSDPEYGDPGAMAVQLKTTARKLVKKLLKLESVTYYYRKGELTSEVEELIEMAESLANSNADPLELIEQTYATIKLIIEELYGYYAHESIQCDRL